MNSNTSTPSSNRRKVSFGGISRVRFDPGVSGIARSPSEESFVSIPELSSDGSTGEFNQEHHAAFGFDEERNTSGLGTGADGTDTLHALLNPIPGPESPRSDVSPTQPEFPNARGMDSSSFDESSRSGASSDDEAQFDDDRAPNSARTNESFRTSSEFSSSAPSSGASLSMEASRGSAPTMLETPNYVDKKREDDNIMQAQDFFDRQRDARLSNDDLGVNAKEGTLEWALLCDEDSPNSNENTGLANTYPRRSSAKRFSPWSSDLEVQSPAPQVTQVTSRTSAASSTFHHRFGEGETEDQSPIIRPPIRGGASKLARESPRKARTTRLSFESSPSDAFFSPFQANPRSPVPRSPVPRERRSDSVMEITRTSLELSKASASPSPSITDDKLSLFMAFDNINQEDPTAGKSKKTGSSSSDDNEVVLDPAAIPRFKITRMASRNSMRLEREKREEKKEEKNKPGSEHSGRGGNENKDTTPREEDDLFENTPKAHGVEKAQGDSSSLKPQQKARGDITESRGKTNLAGEDSNLVPHPAVSSSPSGPSTRKREEPKKNLRRESSEAGSDSRGLSEKVGSSSVTGKGSSLLPHKLGETRENARKRKAQVHHLQNGKSNGESESTRIRGKVSSDEKQDEKDTTTDLTKGGGHKNEVLFVPEKEPDEKSLAVSDIEPRDAPVGNSESSQPKRQKSDASTPSKGKRARKKENHRGREGMSKSPKIVDDDARGKKEDVSTRVVKRTKKKPGNERLAGGASPEIRLSSVHVRSETRVPDTSSSSALPRTPTTVDEIKLQSVWRKSEVRGLKCDEENTLTKILPMDEASEWKSVASKSEACGETDEQRRRRSMPLENQYGGQYGGSSFYGTSASMPDDDVTMELASISTRNEACGETEERRKSRRNRNNINNDDGASSLGESSEVVNFVDARGSEVDHLSTVSHKSEVCGITIEQEKRRMSYGRTEHDCSLESNYEEDTDEIMQRGSVRSSPMTATLDDGEVSRPRLEEIEERSGEEDEEMTSRMSETTSRMLRLHDGDKNAVNKDGVDEDRRPMRRMSRYDDGADARSESRGRHLLDNGISIAADEGRTSVGRLTIPRESADDEASSLRTDDVGERTSRYHDGVVVRERSGRSPHHEGGGDIDSLPEESEALLDDIWEKRRPMRRMTRGSIGSSMEASNTVFGVESPLQDGKARKGHDHERRSSYEAGPIHENGDSGSPLVDGENRDYDRKRGAGKGEMDEQRSSTMGRLPRGSVASASSVIHFEGSDKYSKTEELEEGMEDIRPIRRMPHGLGISSGSSGRPYDEGDLVSHRGESEVLIGDDVSEEFQTPRQRPVRDSNASSVILDAHEGSKTEHRVNKDGIDEDRRPMRRMSRYDDGVTSSESRGRHLLDNNISIAADEGRTSAGRLTTLRESADDEVSSLRTDDVGDEVESKHGSSPRTTRRRPRPRDSEPTSLMSDREESQFERSEDAGERNGEKRTRQPWREETIEYRESESREETTHFGRQRQRQPNGEATRRQSQDQSEIGSIHVREDSHSDPNQEIARHARRQAPRGENFANPDYGSDTEFTNDGEKSELMMKDGRGGQNVIRCSLGLGTRDARASPDLERLIADSFGTPEWQTKEERRLEGRRKSIRRDAQKSAESEGESDETSGVSEHHSSPMPHARDAQKRRPHIKMTRGQGAKSLKQGRDETRPRRSPEGSEVEEGGHASDFKRYMISEDENRGESSSSSSSSSSPLPRRHEERNDREGDDSHSASYTGESPFAGVPHSRSVRGQRQKQHKHKKPYPSRRRREDDVMTPVSKDTPPSSPFPILGRKMRHSKNISAPYTTEEEDSIDSRESSAPSKPKLSRENDHRHRWDKVHQRASHESRSSTLGSVTTEGMDQIHGVMEGLLVGLASESPPKPREQSDDDGSPLLNDDTRSLSINMPEKSGVTTSADSSICPSRPLKRSRQRSEGRNAQKRDEELEFSKESPLKTLHPVRSEILNQKRRGGEGGAQDQSSQESAYSESPKPRRRSRSNTVYTDLSLSQTHPDPTRPNETLEEAPPKWALSDRSESSREVRARELERREASGDQVSCLSEQESMVEAPVPRNSHTNTLDGEGDRASSTIENGGRHRVDGDRGVSAVDARKWPGDDTEGDSSLVNYKNQFEDSSSLVDPQRTGYVDKVGKVDYQDLRFDDDDRSPAAGGHPPSDRKSNRGQTHPSIINKKDIRTSGYAVVSEFGDTSQFDDEVAPKAREKHGPPQRHSTADDPVRHDNQASSSEEDEDECMPPIYADNGRSSMGTAYGEQTFTHDETDLLGRKEEEKREEEDHQPPSRPQAVQEGMEPANRWTGTEYSARKEEDRGHPSSFSPLRVPPPPRVSTSPLVSSIDEDVIFEPSDTDERIRARILEEEDSFFTSRNPLLCGDSTLQEEVFSIDKKDDKKEAQMQLRKDDGEISPSLRFKEGRDCAGRGSVVSESEILIGDVREPRLVGAAPCTHNANAVTSPPSSPSHCGFTNEFKDDSSIKFDSIRRKPFEHENEEDATRRGHDINKIHTELSSHKDEEAASSEEDEDECMPPIYADNGRSSMGTAYGEQTFTHDQNDLLGRKEEEEEEEDRQPPLGPQAVPPQPRLSTPPRKSTTVSEGNDTAKISCADESSSLQMNDILNDDGQQLTDPIFHECVEENDKEEDDACADEPLGVERTKHIGKKVPPGTDMVLDEPQAGEGGRRNGGAAREYVVSDIVSDVEGGNRLFDDDLSTIKSDDLGLERVRVQGREVEQEDSLTEQCMGASDAHVRFSHDAPSSSGGDADGRVPPFYDDHERTSMGLPLRLSGPGDDASFLPSPFGGRPRFSPPAPLPRFSTSPYDDMEGADLHASFSPALGEIHRSTDGDDGWEQKNEGKKEDDDVVITRNNSSHSQDDLLAPSSARGAHVTDTDVLVSDSLENLRQAAHGLPDAHSCESERNQSEDPVVCDAAEIKLESEHDQGSGSERGGPENNSRRTDFRGESIAARTFSHSSSEHDIIRDGLDRSHASNNEGSGHAPKPNSRSDLPFEKRAPTREGGELHAPRFGSPIRPRSLSYSPTSKGDRASISMSYNHDDRIPRGEDVRGRHGSKQGGDASSRCAKDSESVGGDPPPHEHVHWSANEETDEAQRRARSSKERDGGTPLVGGGCGARRRRSPSHYARDEKDEEVRGSVDAESFFRRSGNGSPVLFSPPRTPCIPSFSRDRGSLSLGENDNYKFAVNPFESENSPKAAVSPPKWAPRPSYTPAQEFTREHNHQPAQIDDYEIAEDDGAESDSASWPSVNPNVKPLWRHDAGFSSDDEQRAPEKTPPRSPAVDINAYLKSEGRFEGWSNVMERLPKLPDVYQRSPSEESNIEEHTFPVEMDPIQLDMDTPHTYPLEDEIKSPTSQSSSNPPPESNTARLTYIFDQQDSSVSLSPRPPSIGSSTRREKKSRERKEGGKVSCRIDMTPSTPQSLMSGPPPAPNGERVRVAASPHRGRRSGSIVDSPLQGKHSGRHIHRRPNGKRPRMSRVSLALDSPSSHLVCPNSPSTSSPVPKCSRLSNNDDDLEVVRECGTPNEETMENARGRAQEEAEDFFRAFGVEFGANMTKMSFPGSQSNAESRNYDISRAAAAEWDSKQLMILDGLARLPRRIGHRSQHMEKSLITQYHDARAPEEETEIIEEARYRIKEWQDQAETDFLAKCEIQKKILEQKLKQWKFLFDRKKALQSEGKMLETYFGEMNGQATKASGSDFHFRDYGVQTVDQFCENQTEFFYDFLRNTIEDYKQRYTELEASLKLTERRNVGKEYLRGIIPWYRVDDHLVCNFSIVSIPSRGSMETQDDDEEACPNSRNRVARGALTRNYANQHHEFSSASASASANTTSHHLLYSHPPRFVPKLFCRHTELFKLAFETAFDECLREGGHIPTKMGYHICELEAFYVQIRQFEILEKNARMKNTGHSHGHGHSKSKTHVEASVIFMKCGDCLMIHFSIGDQQLVGPDGYLLVHHTDYDDILARTLFSLQWPVHMWASGPRELEWFKYPSRIHVTENPDIDPAQYEKFTHAIRTKVGEYGKIYDIGSVIGDIKKVAIKARKEFLL